jgi:RecB family exonuclease
VREDQLALFAGEARPDIPSELTEEKIVALWHECFIVDTYATRLEADFARKRGEEMMREYYRWWASSAHIVVAIEKSFSLEVAGLPFSGRLDRVEETEGGIVIIDYKTTQPCSQDEADADLQLSLYALAARHLFEKPCTELRLLFLSDEGVTERTTARSPSQLKDAETQIRLIRERLEAKDFRPTPSIHACKRCPYKGICDVAVK